MERIRVSIDGKTDEEDEIYVGYTDNSLPAPHITLAKDEVIRFLDSSPYDYRLIKHRGIPYLRVYRSQSSQPYEDIPSTPIPTEEGDILEGYFLEGFDLVEIE